MYGMHNLGKVRHCSNIDEKVRRMNLNDNDVIRIITGLTESGGVQNIFELSLNASLPTEVHDLVLALTREYPSVPQFKNDEDAFDFIRSRYAQFGGELDEYVQFLAEELKKEPEKVEPVETAPAQSVQQPSE